MNNTPYIGVTDFTNINQVEVMRELIPPWVDRRLHVGAMISYKTLNNIPTSTGWEKIWLNEAGLNSLFVPDPLVYNVIHYADYPGDDGSVKTSSKDLIEAVRRSGPGVDAIQLDMVWPNQKFVMDLKDKYPKIGVILQVSAKALAYAAKHELSMIDVFSCMDLNLFDYVLLDYGMGKGTPFEPSAALALVETALTVFPERKVAVAGGLGPETYQNLKLIFAKYPDISCDAQGQLRPSCSATDPLDFTRVQKYIQGVCSLL